MNGRPLPRGSEPMPAPGVSAAAPAPPPDHSALFASLYAELHRMARREVRRQGEASPVGATTLLHEAYLALSSRDRLVFPDQAHFLAYAARAMRGLVIDRVRERQAEKRGGAFDITALDTDMADACAEPAPLEALGDALDELGRLEPGLATVVELKYFCGFSLAEIAGMQSVSERTVQRRWEKARLLLYRALGGSSSNDLPA